MPEMPPPDDDLAHAILTLEDILPEIIREPLHRWDEDYHRMVGDAISVAIDRMERYHVLRNILDAITANPMLTTEKALPMLKLAVAEARAGQPHPADTAYRMLEPYFADTGLEA